MARFPKERVEYKINLDDLFGESFTYSNSTKQAIGQAIIDRIVTRTQKNKDKADGSLGTYSESYAESHDGKIFGKKAGRPVNLTATGDMLGLMTIIDITPKTITIGWEDREQQVKAFGHISGMEGHPVLQGKVPKRDFLGLPPKELKKIASEFDDQVRAVDRIGSAQTREELDQAILDTIADLEAEVGIEPLDRALKRQGQIP